MAYQLLVTDYDLTFTNHQRTVTPFTEAALSRVRSAGRQVTLATGRILSEDDPIRCYFKEDVPVIMCNGGILRNGCTWELLYEATLEQSKAVDCIRFCRRYFGALIIWSPAGLFCDRMNLFSRTYGQRVGRMPKVVSNPDAITEGGVYKLFLAAPKRVVRKAQREIAARFSAELSIFTSDPNSLEMVPAGVHKGSGLLKAAELLHIPVEDVIAIGDAENDIPMIRAAGLGIAMANATDPVKAAADIIAPDCSEDGCAKMMLQYLLNS